MDQPVTQPSTPKRITHRIELKLNEATETYEGTINGLPCYSSPDRIGIEFPTLGWRTLSWRARHLTWINGDVAQALTRLWGINAKSLPAAAAPAATK